MGRHATPELDSPTEIIPVAPFAPTRYVAEGRIDFATWWQNASGKRRARLGALLAVPVVAASGFLISETNASAQRSAAAEAASEARDQGAQHAAEMRDSGYSSLAIESNCLVASDGQGTYSQQWREGCVNVAVQVMQTGN